MGYPIISADSHITEHPDTYVEYIDAAWKDKAPRMVRTESRGDVFVIDGMDRPIAMGLVAAAGKPPEELTEEAVQEIVQAGLINDLCSWSHKNAVHAICETGNVSALEMVLRLARGKLNLLKLSHRSRPLRRGQGLWQRVRVTCLALVEHFQCPVHQFTVLGLLQCQPDFLACPQAEHIAGRAEHGRQCRSSP